MGKPSRLSETGDLPILQRLRFSLRRKPGGGFSIRNPVCQFSFQFSVFSIQYSEDEAVTVVKKLDRLISYSLQGADVLIGSVTSQIDR